MLKKVFSTCSFRSFSSSCINKRIFDSNSTLKVLKPLQTLAPTFYTCGDNIKLIYKPSEFYSQLKSNILSAKERIFIATLYIGINEQELIDTIRLALDKTPTLKVQILVDCLRGTRILKQQNTATLLIPLLNDYPNQIQVSMYHTPDLSGFLKRTLPQRFNESIGLMHLKVYGFDNKVMLSGANLGTEYFKNRQDRYITFNNQPELTSYYYNLVKLISSCSYQLVKQENKYDLIMIDNMVDPVKENNIFKNQIKLRIQEFINYYQEYTMKMNDMDDTAVLPVIQMGPFKIKQDENLTLELFTIVDSQSRWTIDLTSGYFNFTEKYRSFILATKSTKFKFLAASPEANGFFNSKGVSRFLPLAYTFIERNFFKQIKKIKKQDDIEIYEFKKPHWSYHAKGLWIKFNNSNLPFATMIGSPNFGYRSSERDLEAQALILTENLNLKIALEKELDGLHTYSEIVTNETFARLDRQVPNGVKIATALVKTML